MMARCDIGADHKPLGLVGHPIEDDSAQRALHGPRARGATRRHADEPGQGRPGTGSSRSHCSVILTLRQLEREGHRSDDGAAHHGHAGAERPRSNGYEAGESNGILAVIESEKKGEASLASQGAIINYELSELRTAVVQASEATKGPAAAQRQDERHGAGDGRRLDRVHRIHQGLLRRLGLAR